MSKERQEELRATIEKANLELANLKAKENPEVFTAGGLGGIDCYWECPGCGELNPLDCSGEDEPETIFACEWDGSEKAFENIGIFLPDDWKYEFQEDGSLHIYDENTELLDIVDLGHWVVTSTKGNFLVAPQITFGGTTV